MLVRDELANEIDGAVQLRRDRDDADVGTGRRNLGQDLRARPGPRGYRGQTRV